MKKNLIQSSVLVALLLIVSACQLAVHNTSSLTPEESPTVAFRTDTILLQDETPSFTFMYDFTPTWTPIPTFSTDEGFVKLLSMFRGTETCKLPCWSGITPGQSNWEQTVHNLNPLSGIISLNTRIGNECDFGKCNYITWLYRNQGASVDGSFFVGIPQNTVRLVHLQISMTPLPEGMKLADMLLTYGLPERVLVDMNPNTTFEPGSTSGGTYIFLLVYPEHRFVVAYYREAVEQGDQLIGCDQENLMQLIILENGESLSTLDGINELSYKYHLLVSGWKTIGEITNMSINSFYELYKGPNPPCITTSVDTWK